MKTKLAILIAKLASSTSQLMGRGQGAMIGGLVGLKIDPKLIENLSKNMQIGIVTGTNGKSTTTKMLAEALSTNQKVATQKDGANMDAGIAAALIANQAAKYAALEVDEMHVPHIMHNTNPETLTLLNLSRDQLDRYGEIGNIEKALRTALTFHPETTVIANCDDILITSIAYDHPKVVWVAAGSNWKQDSTSCPRSEGIIIHENDNWYSSANPDFKRPYPQWYLINNTLVAPDGEQIQLDLQIPGKANLGNAAQAIAAATTMQIPPADAANAINEIKEIAGRYRKTTIGDHEIIVLLAKNPAGWLESLHTLTTLNPNTIIINVNGKIQDGQDLSWLWDVSFEDLSHQHPGQHIICTGERAADLATRLHYAQIPNQIQPNPLDNLDNIPPGKIVILANYTAFHQITTTINHLVGQE